MVCLFLPPRCKFKSPSLEFNLNWHVFFVLLEDQINPLCNVKIGQKMEIQFPSQVTSVSMNVGSSVLFICDFSFNYFRSITFRTICVTDAKKTHTWAYSWHITEVAILSKSFLFQIMWTCCKHIIIKQHLHLLIIFFSRVIYLLFLYF